MIKKHETLTAIFTEIELIIDQYLKKMDISQRYKFLKQWNYLAAQKKLKDKIKER